ncbi:MAG: hypothetical protein WB558_13570 [Terriglobales bacterium]
MDMRALKVGQNVRVYLFSRFKDATVTEMTENYVRIEIAPSVTKWLPKGSERNTKLELVDGKWEKLEWVPTTAGGFWKPVPLLADDLANYNRTANENGYRIDFNYDGSQAGVWEAGGVMDDPRPIADLKIFLKEGE